MRYENITKKVKTSFRTRTFRSGTYIFALAAAAVVMALLVNLIVGSLPETWTKLDVTKNDLYTLSPATTHILTSLDKDVEIFCIVESGREDHTVKTLLERYAELSGSVSVKYIDPVLYPTFTLAYTSETVTQNSLIVRHGDRSTIVDYGDLFVSELNYDSYAYDTYFDGEGALTSAIDYVTREDIPVLYRLTGHGEEEFGSVLSTAIARQNMDIQNLSLVTSEIPEDCRCLVIVGPETDISGAELEKIEKYMANGGKILLFTFYSEESMPNIAKIAAHYGTELIDGIVVDGKSGYSISGHQHHLVPGFGEHEIIEPLAENEYVCLVPIAQGIRVADSLPENVRVSPLLISSEESYIKVPVEYVIESYEYEEGDLRGSFPVAIAAENGDSRLVWITTTYVIEPDIDSFVSGADTDLIINSLYWMTGQEESISISAKSVSVDFLSTNTAPTGFWAVLLIGVLPLSVLTVGIAVHIKRKRR